MEFFLLIVVIALAIWLVRRSTRDRNDVARLQFERYQLERRVTLLEQEVTKLRAGETEPASAFEAAPAEPTPARLETLRRVVQPPPLPTAPPSIAAVPTAEAATAPSTDLPSEAAVPSSAPLRQPGRPQIVPPAFLG